MQTAIDSTTPQALGGDSESPDTGVTIAVVVVMVLFIMIILAVVLAVIIAVMIRRKRETTKSYPVEDTGLAIVHNVKDHHF